MSIISHIDHYEGAEHEPRKVKTISATSIALGTRPEQGETALILEVPGVGDVSVRLPNRDMLTLADHIIATVEHCQAEMADEQQSQ